MRRNLLYHIYPSSSNDVWKWNISLVKQYFDHFDRIIVGIATDGNSDSYIDVSKELSDYPNIELVLAKNVEDKGELTTMPTMLEMVESLKDDEITFYAHAKGVSYSGERLWAVKRWTEAMYYFAFRDIEFIDSIMMQYACAGSFQRGGWSDIKHIQNRYGWHYSGNFWWINHRAFFQTNWKYSPRRGRHDAESLLGNLFKVREAFCLGINGPFPLYNSREWKPPHGIIFKAMQASVGL